MRTKRCTVILDQSNFLKLKCQSPVVVGAKARGNKMPVGFQHDLEGLSVVLRRDRTRQDKLTFTPDLALPHNAAVQAESDLHGQRPSGNFLSASDDSNRLLVLEVGK